MRKRPSGKTARRFGVNVDLQCGVSRLLAPILLVVGGCTQLLGLEDPRELVNDGGLGGSAGSAGDECPSVEPPTTQDKTPMIRLPAEAGCGWIDQHEVTWGSYKDFLASNPDPLEQPEMCREAKDEHTTAACEQEAANPSYRITKQDDHPVTCVDWCDAAAYCQWAGKVLCKGSYTGFGSAEKSMWHAACSNGGTSVYPYGGAAQKSRCHGADDVTEPCSSSSPCSTVPVGEKTECVNDTEVHDLSGNVGEWTDECEGTGWTDLCRIRGGSFLESSGQAKCAFATARERGDHAVDIGFRCCLGDLPKGGT